MMTPDDRVTRARTAAAARWARSADRTAATAPARLAMAQRFYDEVDPERTLSSDEREKLAAEARTAHAVRMQVASANSRRQAKAREVGA
jgi:hypothetical protein